jgi:hypothetical protein
LVLSVGHDEYWSTPMRDHLEKFISDGGNVAFFSGNTCCWQVRSEDNGSALTCWKQNVQQDPVFVARGSQAMLSTLWSHHLVKRPENQLTGVGFLWGGYHKSHGQLMDASGAFHVAKPSDLLPELQGRLPIRVASRSSGRGRRQRISRRASPTPALPSLPGPPMTSPGLVPTRCRPSGRCLSPRTTRP